ncbi:threonine/serine exporter family protein [Corynebacterium sp. ES2794-CONJ1]|uniref:threonine/serine ThrE exporter family protein n=1 Tax=unclassified Corynebacterium TaxID=2624378 RepID=UPI002169B681|nr:MULTISPECIES: threonine/serine exporter family protein [unclassified Corynebacterium]MCS4490283.1 threonine/serine exporter family protein [Corynebacterium sp. ES2775-CONJ]MCS4491906.1 threonine/serine exporter family protein [Corynebacterium sp. ES2715-CONJ3]MCS4532011.1 threonine/serine exporter family protein [Corynebacterium sp. ES2730-CONJ]MCU9519412.1 threonine/serine exporter family protein [Corynebacterium sp. ES2794-CONJ1]
MALLAAVRSLFQTPYRVATIDVARATPLAPLAPVDFSDQVQVSAVLDVAARIGDILIAAGTTHTDATYQVKAILETFGLWDAHVDFTNSRIRIFARISGDYNEPINIIRVISSPPNDYHRLRRVDALIRDIHARRVDVDTADRILTEIITAPPTVGIWGIMASWAVLGGAVTVLIGGDIWVALTSMIAAFAVVWVATELSKKGMPLFLFNAIGGLIVSILAALAYHAGAELGLILRPSMVIATGIIALAAGLTLFQAIQNGISNSPVTGSARFFDTMIATGGIVAGVAMGIALSNYLGIPLPPMQTQPNPNFASMTLRIVAGAFAAAGFARGCFADWSSVWVASIVSLFSTSIFYLTVMPLGLGGITSSAIAATFIGLIGGLLARGYGVPPLIVSASAATPLLPGLAIYRGLYALTHEQILTGFSNLTIALAIAAALSAGVYLGEWIARRIKRPRGLRRYMRFKRMRARETSYFTED